MLFVYFRACVAWEHCVTEKFDCIAVASTQVTKKYQQQSSLLDLPISVFNESQQ